MGKKKSLYKKAERATMKTHNLGSTVSGIVVFAVSVAMSSCVHVA